MFESEADRLASIKALGGEPFDTGNAEKLWAIFDREYLEAQIGLQSVANRKPMFLCRSSDVAAHALVKDSSAVTRDSDGSKFFCLKFEPDGTGMTLVLLRA